MQSKLPRALVVGLGLVSLFVVSARTPQAQVPAQASAQAQPVSPAVVQAVQQRGRVRVIVMLRVQTQLEAALGSVEAIVAQRAAIQTAQLQVLSRAAGVVDTVKQFSVVPGFAASIDATALARFAADPLVERIVEDEAQAPTLAQSVPLINADDVWAAGYTGSGYAVAVLDTGVSKTHEFLDGGKVVSEACYATTDSFNQSTSTCPNGADLQEGTGAGVDCSSSYAGCDHGTHVAGIAAGTGASGGFHGVARNASVIAIQVFSYFPGSTCGGAQCVLTYTSDQILGLERVYALRTTFNIASINMSLGGGSFTANCDSDTRKTIIDNLRAAGIATVIASGNDGFTSAMSSPGCISSAVSVGSTTKSDVVSSFSNSASFLHLLAPGSAINSSVPGNTYSSFNGTSMATPHVAGAWALLKEANPSASVTDILNALINTGVPVTDSRSGAGNRVKPRIDVLAALNSSGAPPPTTLVGPSGSIGSPNPSYTWNKVGSATWYELFVAPTSSPGSPIISQWYQSANVCGASTCSITHATSVASGTPYTWWVRTWNTNGYGGWSGGMSFTATIPPPPSATLVSPNGAVGIARPSFVWNRVDAASQYELFVSMGGTVVRDTWHLASDVCSGSTCSFTVPSDLSTGAHQWWIRTWNPSGYGPWSAAGSFTVGPPGAATLTSPNGTITEATPLFKWVPASGSTWYHLWVNGPGGTIEQWFEASGICNASECSVTSPSALADGSHTWWIRTWSPLGYGPWSSGMNFTRAGSVRPTTPSPVSPTGTVHTMTPTYTFTKVNTATWYQLWVNGPSGNVIAQWYEASAVCGAGANCSATPSTALQPGTHNWWVQAWNTSGYSDWSTMATFTTSSTFVTAVLTWGANPADLDAHLLTPPIGGSAHHVYFGNRGARTSAPFAELDVDDLNGFGPETVSIHQDHSSAGTYKIYVHRWSGSGTLAGSGAQLRVYNNGTLLSTQTVPATGSGDYWLVCEIANLTLTCPNTIMATAPTVAGQASEPAVMKKAQPSEGPTGPQRKIGPLGTGKH